MHKENPPPPYFKAGMTSSKIALREKCPNMEFFLVCIFPYSVRIRENTNQKISVFGHFSHSVNKKGGSVRFSIKMRLLAERGDSVKRGDARFVHSLEYKVDIAIL